MIVDHGHVVGNATRAVLVSNRRIAGLTADVIGELVAEIGPLWHECHQARLVSRSRKRAVGAGAKHSWCSSTGCWPPWSISSWGHPRRAGLLVRRGSLDHPRAISEVRPLLAERGCTISLDVRLRSPAEVVDHLKDKQNAVKSMVVTDEDGRHCHVG
ncbi:hypothetical protein [Streptomyces sp. NPDC002324]